jgi:hypothetical protein
MIAAQAARIAPLAEVRRQGQGAASAAPFSWDRVALVQRVTLLTMRPSRTWKR